VSDTLEIVGACSGIKEKPSGWVDVEVEVPGKQYPMRLSTKDETLVLATRSLAGAVGKFTYVERESDKINPNSGKPYVNRYLEGVEPYAGNGQEPREPKHQPVIGGDKDRAITRLACLKAAAELVAPRAASTAHPDYDAPLEAMKAAQRFEQWVYRDIDDAPFE
jgi:hypothetical protein